MLNESLELVLLIIWHRVKRPSHTLESIESRLQFLQNISQIVDVNLRMVDNKVVLVMLIQLFVKSIVFVTLFMNVRERERERF